LSAWLVLDWDQFMVPAGALAGRPIRDSPSTWPAYTGLVRAAVNAAGSIDTILLGVCTPEQLRHWAIDAWLLLDCSDEMRARRLRSLYPDPDVAGVLQDASNYRRLGLPVVDSSDLSPDETASKIADFVAALNW